MSIAGCDPLKRGIPDHTDDRCDRYVGTPFFADYNGCINVGSLYLHSSPNRPNGNLRGRLFDNRQDQLKAPVRFYRDDDGGRLKLRSLLCRSDTTSGYLQGGGFFTEGRQRVITVLDGSAAPTDTSFIVDLSGAPNDCWNGWLINAIDGKNRNQWRTITDYVNPGFGMENTITLDSPLPHVPEIGDTFQLQRLKRTPLHTRTPIRNTGAVDLGPIQCDPSVQIRLFKSYQCRLKRDSIIGHVESSANVWDPLGATPPQVGESTLIPDSFFEPMYNISDAGRMHWTALTTEQNPGDITYSVGLDCHVGWSTGCVVGENASLGIVWYMVGAVFVITRVADFCFPHPANGPFNGIQIICQGSFDFVGRNRIAPGVGSGVKDFGGLVGTDATQYRVSWGFNDSPCGNFSDSPPFSTNGTWEVGMPSPPIWQYQSPCSLIGREFFCNSNYAIRTPSDVWYEIKMEFVK